MVENKAGTRWHTVLFLMIAIAFKWPYQTTYTLLNFKDSVSYSTTHFQSYTFTTITSNMCTSQYVGHRRMLRTKFKFKDFLLSNKQHSDMLFRWLFFTDIMSKTRLFYSYQIRTLAFTIKQGSWHHCYTQDSFIAFGKVMQFFSAPPLLKPSTSLS